MKNKVIRGVLAAACVTTAVSAANVFGAGTEQSLVNEASAVTQEETEETSEAETIDENTPEMTETETPDSTAENAASDLPAAEVQSGKPEETAVSVQAGSYYPWVNENGIWYFKDPDGTIVKGAWREYDKNRYYLNNDGKMAVGWKKLDGSWYYFQSWGGVYRDAFYTVKNVPYYSDADGKMATGWKLILQKRLEKQADFISSVQKDTSQDVSTISSEDVQAVRATRAKAHSSSHLKTTL